MGLTIATYFGREPFLTWYKTNSIAFSPKAAATRQPRLEDAPTIYELMDEYKTSATKRRVAEAMLQGGEWARPYMVAPGTPADRVAVLRAAFDKVVKDPELLAEAQKLRMTSPLCEASNSRSMAKEVMNQPPEVIEQIKKLFVQ